MLHCVFLDDLKNGGQIWLQDEREALLPTYSQNIDVEVLKLELKWQTKI